MSGAWTGKFDTVAKFRELQQDWEDAARLDQLQADLEVEFDS